MVVQINMKNFRDKFNGAVLAATTGTTGNSGLSGAPGVDLTIQRVFDIFSTLICWFAQIAELIIIGAIIVYGIQMVLSRGNPEKFGEARKSLTFAVIGALVIFGVYTIIATVANAVGADYRSIMPLSC